MNDLTYLHFLEDAVDGEQFIQLVDIIVSEVVASQFLELTQVCQNIDFCDVVQRNVLESDLSDVSLELFVCQYIK